MASPPSPMKEKDITTYVSEVDPSAEYEKTKEGGGDHGATLMASGHIQLTQDELDKLESKLDEMSAEQAHPILAEVYDIHHHDPRYDPKTLERIKMFVYDKNVLEHPELYEQLIYEMRIFALLVTHSSPYPEVRAVTSDTDDPTLPSLTLRVWVIGSILSGIGCVINAIFLLRYPSISIGSNVIQLISFPIGVLWGKYLPNKKIFGVQLNPGPFNRKEHMLIIIMSSLGMAFPPLQHLVFVQAMPQYFDMAYARNPGYQILGALSTNMIGFGFAGITRRFLVYPSYCVWPTSLSTIALNNALHDHGNAVSPVRGPGHTVWKASMYKCFWVVFGIYFLYFFFPAYIFPNLSIFDWIAWIKPTNGNLVQLTSLNFGSGFGINPFPTFDYNYLSMPGGYYPMFVHYNFFGGFTLAMIASIILWSKNAWNSGYIQLNSPGTFDNKGSSYKVAKIVDKAGRFDSAKYQTYSEPYLSAARLITTMGTFAYTSATLTHTLLYNFNELKLGFRGAWFDMRTRFNKIRGRHIEEDERQVIAGDDIHFRLMQAYKETPEWWFVAITLLSMAVGFICLGVYTDVSPAVVMIAPIITLIFVIPVGIVTAVSGLEPSLNIISEMIGGLIAPGDTMTVQFFRLYGSEPTYHALIYANDLKLSHYVKIAPRHMFIVQIWGALIGTFVTVAQWNWLMDLPGVCTPDAPMRLICPAATSNYSTFIFWGTIGAPRLFGPEGRYKILLIGFPLGVLVPIMFFLLKKKFTKSLFLQSVHPLLFILSWGWLNGGHWGAYVPGLFINYFSWNFLKRKYLEFWTRYNYVTLAALGAAISINGLLVFWALIFPQINFPEWWGNPASQPGCIGKFTNADCALFKIDPARGYFGPDPGNFVPK